MVDGNHFYANHVPLTPRTNTITVRATTSAGQEEETVITVTSEITTDFIRIDAAPQTGLAPFETTLTVGGTFERIAPVTLTVSGPGQVTFIDISEDTFDAQMTVPGLYQIVAEVLAPGGEIFGDTVIVKLWDNYALEAMLKAKWNDMKANLSAGNIAGALDYFGDATRANYETIFTSLIDALPQIAQDMQDIEMISAGDGMAKFRILRNEIHQGQAYDITYKIYFDRADSGIWKIDRF